MNTRVLNSLTLLTLLLVLPFARADDLTLDLTTRLGIDKAVKVKYVIPVANDFKILREERHGSFLDFSSHTPFTGEDKSFLILGSQASMKYQVPSFVAGIRWTEIKKFTNEKQVAEISCTDSATFKGVILTEVTGMDDSRFPLWQCSRLEVKKFTSNRKEKPHDGATAKCHVRLDNREHSFVARKIGYETGFALPSAKFEMKVGGEYAAGVLSDFDKVIVKGTESGPIQITVRAPSGKETTGELKAFDNTSFGFRAANGCALVLHLRSRSVTPTKASFQITIENSKAGERLPIELFNPVRGK